MSGIGLERAPRTAGALGALLAALALAAAPAAARTHRTHLPVADAGGVPVTGTIAGAKGPKPAPSPAAASTTAAPADPDLPLPGLATPSASPARFHLVAYGPSVPVATEAPRRDLWIAGGHRYGLIPQWQAFAPTAGSLVYKEGPFIESDNAHPAASTANGGGVSMAEAEAHPEWFLLDAQGARIHHDGYAPYVLMDLGHPGYQDRWATNVIAQLRRDGWTGVFADDLSLQLYNAAAAPAKYPTVASWQAATRAFLAAVGARLHAAGFALYANTSGGVSDPGVRRDWLALVDGSMEEGWMRPSVDHAAPLANATTGAWQAQLRELEDAEAQGKRFLVELPAAQTDLAAIRYGFASYLLVAAGGASFDVAGDPHYETALWFPEYDAARALGAPTGPFAVLANGIRRRDFAGGAVLVNPTTATRSADLGAAFTAPDLRTVTSVALGPTSGVVLRRG